MLTHDKAHAIAAQLRIRQTRAPQGSPLWECWFDRVAECKFASDRAAWLREARRTREWFRAIDHRDAMRNEANRFAV
jgi:hypothetical protein